jgi:replicative DNA helicase
MIKLFKIKDLTHEAICLLEASYSRGRPDRFGQSFANVVAANSLVLPHREIITLCKSAWKTKALFLGKMVSQLAIEKKTPTLLISGQPSLTILAVNLLLCRAGIHLEDVIKPAWTENDFARLTRAAGELAHAPLLVAGEMPFMTLKNTVHSAVAKHGTRRLVVDNPPSESFGQWLQISREYGLPVILISQGF